MAKYRQTLLRLSMKSGVEKIWLNLLSLLN